MPELPEVENIVRGLKPLEGQKVVSVQVLLPQTVWGRGNVRKASEKKKREFIDSTQGRFISSVKRKAKNIVFELSGGGFVVAHLKMTGQFIYDPNKKIDPSKHTRIIFGLSKGRLLFNDIRRFGYVVYAKDIDELEKEGFFLNVGPDPFDKDFSIDYFFGEIAKRKSNIKTILMSQKVVSGLGNIYVDESLFAAKISPLRKGVDVSRVEAERLHAEIIKILNRAIDLGGSSIRNYRLASGEEGSFVKLHQVYGKAGEPCPRCKSELSKTVIGSRTTVYCGNCQV